MPKALSQYYSVILPVDHSDNDYSVNVFHLMLNLMNPYWCVYVSVSHSLSQIVFLFEIYFYFISYKLRFI